MCVVIKDLEDISAEPGRNRFYRWLLVGVAVCGFANVAAAGTLSISGLITQSTDDFTGPAVNNMSLNNVHDNKGYTVTLVFPGTIALPGTYNLTGSSLTFNYPTPPPATESSFASISLTVTANGVFDDLSLLGCLTTGGGCMIGNELTANFRIPASMLNSQNVAAIGLDQPHPLDLLEDDGTTDIQGSIRSYSYNGPASTVPEPSLAVLLGCVLTGFVAANRTRIKKEKNI